MLRLCRNHSAFNSHNFPRTCTTTYLFSMLLCHSNRHAPTRDACRFGTYLVASGCTYGLVTVSFHSIRWRSLSLPFQLRALHDPLRDYSPPILPLCIQYIQPTCRDCTPHVPRRLWKVRDSNPRAFQLTTNRRYCLRPLSQPSPFSVPCDSVAKSCCPHLNSFMSSYTPLRMFIAISCCG